MTTTAVVLDGNQRAALAVVRSLGRRGVRIIVCSTQEKSLAGASRWCQREYQVPAAHGLLPALERIVEQEHATAVFPITDATILQLVGRTTLSGATVACPPEAAYNAVSDKAALAQRALALDVPVPRSSFVSGAKEFRFSLREWTGPVVIKPAWSRYQADNQVNSTSVAIANDRDEALALLPGLDWFAHVPCLLQEFIPGHGAGVFTVYSRSGPVQWFSHSRIREKPPSGGVSVLCESAPSDTEMVRLAKTLLDDAVWLGPAMVEFRVDAEGKPWLMEINGRFWGSLQLSVDCGVDMPWLWFQTVTGASPKPAPEYRTGLRLRWLLGDLDSTYLSVRDPGKNTREKLVSILRFLNFFSLRTRFEVLRVSDIRPFFRELRKWLRAALLPGKG